MANRGPSVRTHPASLPAILRWVAAVSLAASLAGLSGCRKRSTPPAPASQSVAADATEVSLRSAVAQNPGAPQPRLDLVRYLLEIRHSWDALEAAREAQLACPDSVPVRAAVAEALFAAGRVSEAARALRPIYKLTADYRITLANYLVTEGKFDEAARLLDRVPPTMDAPHTFHVAQVLLSAYHPAQALPLLQRLQRDSEDPEVWSHLGYTAMWLGKYAEARAALARAVQLAPEKPLLHYRLACALLAPGSPPNLAKAREELEAELRLQPDSALASYALGTVRARLGDRKGAIESLEAALAAAAGMAEAPRDLARLRTATGERLEAAVARAHFLRLVGDPQAAVTQLLPWRRDHSGSGPITRGLAEAYLEAGRLQEYASLRDALLKAEPHNEEVLRDALQQAVASGSTDEVVRLTEALRGVTGKPTAYTAEHADALLKLGRADEARAELTRLRDTTGDAAASIQLGNVELHGGGTADVRAAEEAYRAAVRLKPTDAMAHYRLGTVLSAQHPDEAAAHLRTSLNLQPAYPDALSELGRCYRRLGHGSRAEEAFTFAREIRAFEQRRARLEAAARRQPPIPSDQVALARFLVNTHDDVAAVRVLESVLHAAPRQAEARALLISLYASGQRYPRLYEERAASTAPPGSAEAAPLR